LQRKGEDEPDVKVEVIESSVSAAAAAAAAMVPSASKPGDALLPQQAQQQQQPPAGTTGATGELDGLKKSRPATKSKKKKNVPAGENTGRWTAEEHRLFLQGLEQHGKGWKKIAGLIKSRTVVQIRTHAQKYFQKLAKARQNGEDGDVALEATAAIAAPPLVAPKLRRLAGTKRKPIQSVVASAQRQGKKLAVAQAASGVPNPMAPLPAISPVLAHFVVSSSTRTMTMDEIPEPGTVTGQELEDAVYVIRYNWRCCAPSPLLDSLSLTCAHALTHRFFHTSISAGRSQIPVPYAVSSS
jgi:SHAQKYF class myb-like DNA-binding protein